MSETLSDPTLSDPTLSDPTLSDPTLGDPTLGAPTVAIAASADARFAMPTAVMLYSALAHLRPGAAADIYIIDDGVAVADKARLQRVLRGTGVPHTVRWLPAGPRIDGAQLMAHLSPATYQRLNLPALLPGDLDRILYLDGDMIVQSDLVPLWESDLDGHAILAAYDGYVPAVSSPHCGLAATYRDLGLDPDAPYFNAGVMLMNLPRWRRDDLGPRVARYAAEQNATLMCSDQDALNAVLARDWGQLDPRWNVFTAMRQVSSSLSEAVRQSVGGDVEALHRGARILHFAGDRKPWNALLLDPSRRVWHAYLERSRWHSPLGYRLWRLRWMARALWRAVRRRVADWRTRRFSP